MVSADDIIDALGGTGKVAAALSVSDSTVSGWRERGIPAPHWAALVRLASERGVGGVSLENLAAIVARKPDSSDALTVEART
jgi:hypothetical protein